MDVESYISENGLDAKAAEALRGEDEAVQMLVMQGPSLSDVRNTSSVVMGRIRKAKFQSSTIAKNMMAGITVDPSTLEEFINENEIDEKAANELRGEDPAIQQAVMDSGPLTTAKNKSSALMGRICKAKQGRLVPGGGTVSLGESVQNFLAENDVDEKAAANLKGEPSNVQQAVIEMGPLSGATNQSSALMARLARAKKNLGIRKGDGGGGGGAVPGMEEMMQAMMMQQMLMGSMMGGGMGMGGMGMPGMGMGGMGGGMDMMKMMSMMGGGMGKGGPSGGAVGKFIAENNLDERAAADLRREPAHIQKAVMDGGSLENANNPSSAVLSRIKKAKQGGGGGMGAMQGMMGMMAGLGGGGGSRGSFSGGSPELQAFVAENGIDDRAAQELSKESSVVQEAVMAMGPLTNAANPSSALIGRIRNAKKGNSFSPY